MSSFTPTMNRSVMQLLFTYLPDRTVDWENGAAIVVVGSPRLDFVWPSRDAKIVLDEVSHYLARWRNYGGRTDTFPDPAQQSSRFVVGTPLSVNASVLITALRCYECSQLVFRKRKYLAQSSAGPSRVKCPNCSKQSLRQFGLVFVHGCGNLVPLTDEIPIVGKDGTPKSRYVRCGRCNKQDSLALDGRSDRAAGYRIICRRCRVEVIDRLVASCRECARRFVVQHGPVGDGGASASLLRKHTLMRITRHSASEAYYAHSLTMLRLGRVAVIAEPDEEMKLLQLLLPPSQRARIKEDATDSIDTLVERARKAQQRGDQAEFLRLMTQIAETARRTGAGSGAEAAASPDAPEILTNPAPDIGQGILESQTLLETVRMQSALLVAERGQGPAAGNVDQAKLLLHRLGIRRLEVVDDLPIIAASFGYSRRSFQPVYAELGENLPTALRPFPPLDSSAALSADRRDVTDKLPVLAREAEHEGLLLALDETRVVRWLKANGVGLPDSVPPRAAILQLLEPVNRYYDDIWDLSARRLVFGLLHTISHAAMRAASLFAGLDRTSISEYLFLPLLGTVVYANSSTFKMGGMEVLARDHLSSFLEAIASEAVSCLYDPDCLDRHSACHGCIHSPEISCRVFNHGLGRTLLIGGRPPWPSRPDERVVGYWEDLVAQQQLGTVNVS